MWYLNIYMILSLLGVVVLLAAVCGFTGGNMKGIRKVVLLIFSLGFVFVFSRKLAAFYVTYALFNYILFLLILKMKSKNKFFFIGAIILNVGAISLLRVYDLIFITNTAFAPIIIVGFIYTLLKAIDTHYYAYYIENKVSLINYINYILFIPTFTSGPIIKLKDFNEDINKEFKFNAGGLEKNVKRIILGLFKKVVLVSIMVSMYDSLLLENLNFFKSSVILILYYFLLFFDFSGYSDIAIGFGSLMGFRIPENFKKPFSSPTLTQFWRNWHASLGDWFREHIFNLFSRKINSRVIAGIMSFFIMLLIGLWHGFNLLFILWGAYHGILLLIENVLKLTMVNKRKVSVTYFWSRCFLTNALVAFGTIFFSQDLHVAAKILRGFLKFS